MNYTRPEPRQHLVVLPLGVDLRRRRQLASRSEERRRSAGADEHRKRFVERSLASRVECVVRQLVDYRVGQVQRITFERGVEQRVVEEAQGTESIRRSHVYIEAVVG